MLHTLHVDPLAFAFCFGRGDDAVSFGMMWGRPVDIGQFMDGNSAWRMTFCPVEHFVSTRLKRLHVHRLLVGHLVARDVNFNVCCRSRCGIEKQTMAGMKAVKGTAHQTSVETGSLSHEGWFGHEPLRSSPRLPLRRASWDCAPTPNGLVHCFLRGLTLGVGAYCPVRWLSCVHSCVAQGPITHRWFTAFAPEFTPRRVVPVFDCGRTRGVRRHCSFHSRSA